MSKKVTETVVGRWTRDLSDMRRDANEIEKNAGEMKKQALQRWKNVFEVFNKAHNASQARLRREITALRENTEALKKTFKEFANEVNERAQERFAHIWGTLAEKEAWEKSIGSR